MDIMEGGPGIPRLQELSFLEVAAQTISQGGTLEEVRRRLIDHMAGLRESNTPTGNSAISRRDPDDPDRYLNNAVKALVDLMRLGLAQKSRLPSSRSAAAAYRQRSFELTEEGADWVAQLSLPTKQDAYDSLLQALWHRHPKFAGYIQLLKRNMFVIPTANWTEVQRATGAAVDQRTYMVFLASRAARAVAEGVTGWHATEDEIARALDVYIEERLRSAAKKQRPDPYPRHRDFVSACEEAVVSFAFRQAKLPLDYTSHQILRRWTKDLGIANFSYHVPAAPALRLWVTADIEESDATLNVRRRKLADWGDRVIDALPEGFEQARRQSPSNSWVPIHRVRAAVCSKLGLNDPIFDKALEQHLSGERCRDAPFRINLDPASFGNVPPTEAPFTLSDRSGRQRVYYVMTLIPASERRLP
jgi:hypothetical protein